MASVDDTATNEGHEQCQFSYDDYTIGWICALTKEYVAAQVFLDQKHAPLPAYSAIYDNNHYALGRVGKHNVAIAVLPNGEYGTTSAAGVARDMLCTFPNIRIGLMVGIGGGAPSSKHDIRLGDVVVSKPQNGLGGVLQYDFGRDIQDPTIQSMGILAMPPPILLTAIDKLRAIHEINGNTIREDVEARLVAENRLRKSYGRPDRATDRLYHSNVVHPLSEASCLSSCGRDVASLVVRPVRDGDEDNPVVHYGVIASANQLMKDAKLRDQYATERDILCFEMEAGGLMSHFPCVVIRGICDYSDTHKNNEWQGYAAMTAAAYAKQLLKSIPPPQVEAQKNIGQLVVHHFNKAVQWLSAPDSSTNLNHARALHQPGTCRWFLDSDKYLSWKTGQLSFLCGYGLPGCGKTILSSAIIADLEEDYAISQRILYFYFDFTDIEKNSTEKAVRSLIHQLYRKRAGVRDTVDLLYTSYHKSGQQPTYTVLQTVLNTAIQEFGEIWIVLDGLDECETRNRHGVDGVISWIRTLRNLTSGVHLLITSRPEQDIKSSIDIWVDSEEVFFFPRELAADDIEVYIHAKVGQMIRWQSRPDVQKLVATTLNNHANGMFRWVACQLHTLELCLSPADVSRTLAELPRTLDQTYAQILDRLPHEYKGRAIRLLQILVCSKGPLVIEEALNTIVSQPRFDPASRWFIEEELARLCSSLVCFTPKFHDTTGNPVTEIQLVHFSVQEYLQSHRLAPSIATFFDEETLARDFPNQLAPKRALAKLMVDVYSEISTANVDKQSDVSDVSYVSSVVTEATDLTVFSQVPAQSRDPLQTAAQTLAQYLYKDSAIHAFYSDAVQEFGSIRFSLHHDRLLKIFWKDVFQVTTEPHLELLARILAKRQSRRLVTMYILRFFQIELDSSREGAASLQRFLDQQEDRNYSLNHFLRSQQPAEAVTDMNEDEDSDNDEDTDDEGDIEDSEPGAAIDVEKVLNRIIAGAPYQTFKSNLACLAHPPTDLAEALNTKSLRAVRRLLRKRFDYITQDEYAWLRDLEDLGYTRDEIAEILLEEANDSPWIYFTPPPEPDLTISLLSDSHIIGCVHSLTQTPLNQDRQVHAPILVSSSSESSCLSEIHRLCGLAGITPSSRNYEEWNGSVSFEEDNSAALITYGHSDVRKVLSRLEVTLRLLSTAIKRCQAQQLCCDSFTIITLPPMLSDGGVHDPPLVAVHRIDFCVAFQLLKEVRVLIAAQDVTSRRLPAATRILEDIFQKEYLAGISEEVDLPTAIHECSLAIQMMCLGLLSYLQAHVGPLHPVFLDTPIKKAKLFGCHRIEKEHSFIGIEIALVNLTCLGEMLQGPVLVFKLAGPALPSMPTDWISSSKFDLFTSAEDLVDTWGPAQFISPVLTDFSPCAIKIGSGIISASNSAHTEFHWSRDGSLTELPEGILDLTRKIRIGSPVSVNTDCVLDESLCRARSEDYGLLRYLGTFTPGWKLAEKQIGIQAGQYAVMQANAGYHKYPGRTLKEYRLKQEDSELLSFLEDRWAVQVSLCTNIARRVPLRQMVADLLPVFANTMTCNDDCLTWDSLRADDAIFTAFQGTELQQWLRDLPASHHDFVLRMIRRILNILKDSGIDHKGESLLISWPYGRDVYQCLEINLSQQESYWARILADSEDCATFAYASPHCLETEEYRCRKAELSCSWRSTILLLETAVTISVGHEGVAPQPAVGKLVHQGRYYFKSFDSVHMVKAEQPDPTAVAKLVRKKNLVPDKMKHRLYGRTQLTKRIRERSRMQDVGESVAWLTSSI